MAFLALAELLLNGLHLLVQVVLALAALHLLLDPATDALLDLQQVDLGIQQTEHMLDPAGQVGNLEDFLLLLDAQRHVRRHGIDQARRIVDTAQRAQHLGGHLLAQLHVLLELTQQAAAEDFRLALGKVALLDQAHFGACMGFAIDEALDRTALATLDQHLDRAIRQLEQLQHAGHGAHLVQRLRGGIIVRRVLLGQQQNLLVCAHRRLKRLDGLFTPDEQRDDHVRIDHHITQRQKGQLDDCVHAFNSL
ncbi:hypothetical protein D3C78_685640 [compost metagenome]